MSDIWYFAYGANMSPAVLRRRNLDPLSSEAARLDGYSFGFTHKGILPLEPCFANIQPAPGRSMHGVLHRLRCEDMDRLDQIEGAEYLHQEVKVVGSDSGPKTARAYMDPNPVLGLKPSRRYLENCCEGARSFDLPKDYLEEMASHPHVYVPILSGLTTFLVRAMEGLHRRGFRPELVRMKLRGTSGRGSGKP
jgi:hypothetical protein